MAKYKELIKLITAMLIFGTLSIFVRNIPLASSELALYRAILAVIVLTPYALFSKNRIIFAEIKKQIPLLCVSGIAIGVNWILLFEAYNNTTISMATLSYYFAPTVVTILCPFIFRERMRIKQIVCFCLSTIGVALIIGAGTSDSKNDLVGILFGLGAALLYAFVIILNKFISDVTGLQRTFVQFSAAAVVLLPYVALTSGFNLTSLNAVGIVDLLIVGIVHTGLAYCLYLSAIKHLKGQQTAILSYIDPLVAIIVSVIVLKEQIPTLWQIVGGVLILVFAIINELPRKHK
ncbi:MAG: EamA family transporter [Acutalibacteraceae bacterium]|nr:EamA family transporter [Acutalibacteraceae bacterium]